MSCTASVEDWNRLRPNPITAAEAHPALSGGSPLAALPFSSVPTPWTPNGGGVGADLIDIRTVQGIRFKLGAFGHVEVGQIHSITVSVFGFTPERPKTPTDLPTSLWCKLAEVTFNWNDSNTFVAGVNTTWANYVPADEVLVVATGVGYGNAGVLGLSPALAPSDIDYGTAGEFFLPCVGAEQGLVFRLTTGARLSTTNHANLWFRREYVGNSPY